MNNMQGGGCTPKQVNEMTNEELWELFPIIITEHDPSWKEKYACEKQIIEQAIASRNIVRISHIGSTAIPGLVAKPTIDILLEIADDTDNEKLISDMISIGYLYSPQPEKPAPHMMFMKGYTTEGFKGQVFHVHVRYEGDWDEIYFMDYLRAHPEAAEEYGALKLTLKDEYEHDRDRYTDSKTDFVRRITEIARKERRGDYMLADLQKEGF
jgi:GrpB-like predicted nucleotidyltransferase (UPF0157 family)